ncbi:hypothetical protein GGG16DRAFT_110427 [Schizophyllum commune]
MPKAKRSAAARAECAANARSHKRRKTKGCCDLPASPPTVEDPPPENSWSLSDLEDNEDEPTHEVSDSEGEPAEDDDHDPRDTMDSPEIESETLLAQFHQHLKKARDAAAAREPDAPKKKKKNTPLHYNGRSKKTRKRHENFGKKLELKGFLGLRKFMSMKQATKSASDGVRAPTPTPAPDEGFPVDEQVPCVNVRAPDEVEDGTEVDVEETTSDEEDGACPSEPEEEETIAEEAPDPQAEARRVVDQMLKDLRAGRLPADQPEQSAGDRRMDDVLAMQTDKLLLRRARDRLKIKSKNKKIDVVFRARISAMLGVLNLFLTICPH